MTDIEATQLNLENILTARLELTQQERAVIKGINTPMTTTICYLSMGSAVNMLNLALFRTIGCA
jgi:hypothetical protein